jgi:valyl-tRNA synthetase
LEEQGRGEKGKREQRSSAIEPDAIEMTLADRWILARLASLERDAARLFQGYQYGEAGRQIYDFFWNEFADWYLEIAKLQLAEGGLRSFSTAHRLVQVLDASLRLLHPFTPFITEELWGHLKAAALEASPAFSPPNGWEEALIVARWPEPPSEEGWESQAVADFTLVMEIVRAIRNLRAEKNVPPGRRIPAILLAGEHTEILRQQSAAIAALAQLDAGNLNLQAAQAERPADHISLVVGPVEIYLPLGGIVDASAERARLEKDLAEAEVQIQRLEALLASPFAGKAPASVVQKERDRLAGYRETAEKIRVQLEALG